MIRSIHELTRPAVPRLVPAAREQQPFHPGRGQWHDQQFTRIVQSGQAAWAEQVMTDDEPGLRMTRHKPISPKRGIATGHTLR